MGRNAVNYTMLNIITIAHEIQNLLIDKGLDPPSSVVEYDWLVSTYLHKYHRATLSRTGISCADLLLLIDPEYEDLSKFQMFGFSKYRYKADSLGLVASMCDDKSERLFTQKDRVKLSCITCSFTEVITGTSLNRRKNGCKKCSGSANWNYRVDELHVAAKSKGLEVVKIGVDSKLDLRCIHCSTLFTRALGTLVYSKYTTDCPTCKPPKIFGKMGVPNIYDNIEFDSLLEKEVYILLKDSAQFTSIQVHVPYYDISINSNMVADFFLDNNIVLEVSTFSKKYHPEYHAKIEQKRVLVQNAGLIFSFCSTLAEVRERIFCS